MDIIFKKSPRVSLSNPNEGNFNQTCSYRGIICQICERPNHSATNLIGVIMTILKTINIVRV